MNPPTPPGRPGGLPDLSAASDEALLAGLEHLLAELERRVTRATLLGQRAGERLTATTLTDVHLMRAVPNGGPPQVSDNDS
jgi:hypothetical protein